MKEQGKEMFEFGETEPKVEIGTEILDPSLPSNLDFDSKKGEYEGKEIKNNPYSTKKSVESFVDSIRNYTVKGKKEIEWQPEFRPGSTVKANMLGFEVKCYDDQKSSGLKGMWESIMGYSKRQMYISNGYLYLMEKVKVGYLTHGVWKLSYLFKIFVDTEDAKLRLVFRPDPDQPLINKNFYSPQYEDILSKLSEQIDKVGLTVTSS